MKKIITSLFIFVFLMLFVNNVNAVTINESTDPTNGLTTIEDNSIIIGVTRFEDGVVITAQRAATAGVNDALFNIGVDGYSGVNIYYYLGGSWFVLDDENQANPLDESNPEDRETIEELESPEIYYVNNVEKQLTVDFTFDGEGSLEFNTDNNKDGLVSFADGKLTIPATVKSLQIKIKDSDTGDVLGLVVLTKDPDNNTDYETTSTTSLTNYINALGRVVKADYTEASWTTYQSVVLANVVTENNTQGEVDTATTNITTAQGSLVFAGLADLNTAKASAAALTETDYTTTSWTTLQTALGLPETTNAEVVTKTTNITTAQGSLVFAGLADLNTAKASAAALTETDYTTTSWTTLQTALGLPETTNAEVVTKTTTLNNAINALVTKLAQAKLDAKEELTTALGTYTGSDYTEGNWTILNGYKTTGDTAIENATTVGEVSTAKTTALEAMDGVLTNAEILAEAKADAIAAIGVNYLVGTPRILTQTEISAIGITVGADQKLFEVMITPDYANLETAQLSGRAVNTVFTVATPNITVYYPHWNGTTNVLESGDSTGSGGPYIVGMAAYPLSYPNLENPAPFYVLVNDTIDADVSITIKLEDSEWNDVLYANQTIVKDYNELLLMIAKYEAYDELSNILSQYIEAHYTTTNWTTLNTKKTQGDTAIENATTVGEVSTAKTTALEAMAAVLTQPVINTTSNIGYPYLYTAVNSASSGDNIKLTRNLSNLSKTTGTTTVDGKVINLDLAGNRITIKATAALDFAFVITSTGELIISDSSGTNSAGFDRVSGYDGIQNKGKLTINGGTYNTASGFAIVMEGTSSETTINDGIFNSFIGSNGITSGGTLTINGGTFTKQLYLAAANSSTIIKGGTFTSLDAEESVIEIKAGTLTIDNGTFTYNFDTSNNNKSVARNNGAGLITGVIVAVKPSGANETNAYASPIIVNLNGGTFTNTMGDAIVSADQSGIGNTFGITLNVEPEAAIIGNIVNYDKPILENVLPEAGNIILENNDQFVLIVDAFDVNLYELEIDHSMEGILPEFSVYADATNPYGTLEDKDSFEAQSVNVTYDATLQKWTINFGSKITNAFIANKGITFYLVLKDTKGNTWGSMYEVNESNTFAYNVSVAYNGPVNGIITDDGPKITGIVNFLGEEDLIISGSFTALTADNYTPFEGELDGSIKGTVVGGVNDNGIDTLSGVITLSSGVSLPIRIIGIFGQTGIDGDFAGEIITGPIPTYVESINITSAGGIDTINVGETLQLGVDILPIEATSNVAWSVYVNDVETGDIDDSGLFTATTPGTATIIAKALDGSLKDDTFDITINH